MTERANGEILLGVDAGTSAVKVCAYFRDGHPAAMASRAVRVASPRPGHAEIDVEDYWSKVVEAVREVASKVGRVAAVGISATSPTTIAVDADGKAIGGGIVYLDQRSDAIVRERCCDIDDNGRYFVRIGNRPGCSTSWLANLCWLARHDADAWRRVRRVLLLGGYLVSRMTGRATIDWTQASYSGGFRVGYPEAGWDRDSLSFWGVDPDILPEPGWSCRAAGCLLSDAASAMGLNAGTAVAFGSADTAAAAFAMGVREAGDVFESSGTSGVITFCLDRPDFDETFMNRCHVFPGRWLAHGAMSTFGGAFGWLRGKIWPEIDSPEELERLASASPPGANGLVFLPYLAGERSPIWDAEASGIWVGLRLDSTRADMVRAVFEGTVFGLRQIFERGKKRWGYVPSRLIGVGGGSTSRLWSEIKTDVLGVEYVTADHPAAAAWGAAMMGGVAGGVFSGTDDPDLTFLGATGRDGQAGSRPRDDNTKRAYERAFAVYERLYPALREEMHLLAERERGEA